MIKLILGTLLTTLTPSQAFEDSKDKGAPWSPVITAPSPANQAVSSQQNTSTKAPSAAFQDFKHEVRGDGINTKPYHYLSPALRLLTTKGKEHLGIIKEVANSKEIIAFYLALKTFFGPLTREAIRSEVIRLSNDKDFQYLQSNNDFQNFTQELIKNVPDQ